MKSSDVKNEFDVNFDDAGEFAFHLRREEVCVNPYHYTKVSQLWEGGGSDNEEKGHNGDVGDVTTLIKPDGPVL